MKICHDAQAVLCQQGGETPLFLVVYRHDPEKNEDHYRLVKGGIKKGETPEQAVAREVNEEVGISTLENVVPFHHYQYTIGEVTHEVSAFFLKASGNISVRLNSTKEGGFNLKSWKWVTAPEAMELLNFPEEKNLIEMAVSKFL